MELAIEERATEILGARAISSFLAPITWATLLRRLSSASSQCEYHAEDPMLSHSSRNRSWAARTRLDSGAREQVLRYVFSLKIGNSSLHAVQSITSPSARPNPISAVP